MLKCKTFQVGAYISTSSNILLMTLKNSIKLSFSLNPNEVTMFPFQPEHTSVLLDQAAFQINASDCKYSLFYAICNKR